MRRTFDILSSLILLLLTLPLSIIIGIIIKLNSKGPIIFTQMRIGKDNVLFKFYKFRTMKVGAPNVATEIFDRSKGYITSFGKILRKSSLDELPQLINIFKGDMTFVGPRPALFNQYELKSLRTQEGIHKLLPGVTGWAQVNGRDMLDDSMKTYYDKEYLNNKSIAFDLKIIARTIIKVLKADGIMECKPEKIIEVEERVNIQA